MNPKITIGVIVGGYVLFLAGVGAFSIWANYASKKAGDAKREYWEEQTAEIRRKREAEEAKAAAAAAKRRTASAA